MKRIPMNTMPDGTAKAITHHYHKVGWSDLTPFLGGGG